MNTHPQFIVEEFKLQFDGTFQFEVADDVEPGTLDEASLDFLRLQRDSMKCYRIREYHPVVVSDALRVA